jgi:hypothetical protein
MIKERFRVKQKIEIWMEIIEGSGSFYLKLIMRQAPAASTKVFGPAWGGGAPCGPVRDRKTPRPLK